MKKAMLTALLGLSLLNCATVTSGQPTTGSVNGDTWYTKDKYLPRSHPDDGLGRLLLPERDAAESA